MCHAKRYPQGVTVARASTVRIRRSVTCGDAFGAEDLEQSELLGGLRLGRGGEEYELLVMLRRQERFAVELDEPDLGMDQPLVALPRDLHLVFGPQPGELLALAQQSADQVLDVGITVTAGRGGAQVRDAEPAVLVVVRGRKASPPVRVGEPAPGDARRPAGVDGLVAEQRLGEVVHRKELLEVRDDEGRAIAQVVEQPQDGGPDMGGATAAPRWRPTRQPEQVVALVVAEPQRPRQGRQHLVGRSRRAGLLEPYDVVDRHSGELSDLLAAQSGRTSAAPAGQSDLLGSDAFAAAPDEVGELGLVHGLRMARPRRSIQGPSLPG